jgi:hypothetical protein
MAKQKPEPYEGGGLEELKRLQAMTAPTDPFLDTPASDANPEPTVAVEDDGEVPCSMCSKPLDPFHDYGTLTGQCLLCGRWRLMDPGTRNPFPAPKLRSEFTPAEWKAFLANQEEGQRKWDAECSRWERDRADLEARQEERRKIQEELRRKERR